MIARALAVSRAEASPSVDSRTLGIIAPMARKAKIKNPVKIPRFLRTNFGFLILKLLAKLRRVFER